MDQEYYKTIKSVFCPYLGKEVFFNSKGLGHLKFKAHNKVRTPEEKGVRFKFLHFAPLILRLSSTLQGIRKDYQNTKITIYYEFIAIISEARFKIIIKQIDCNPPFFWSIIPFWKKNSETKIKKMHEGDPEED